jgi:hypothetical protein
MFMRKIQYSQMRLKIFRAVMSGGEAGFTPVKQPQKDGKERHIVNGSMILIDKILIKCYFNDIILQIHKA